MIKSFLNYPGAKWRLAPEIVKIIPEHRTYLEPFFGSGAVFFTKKPSGIETVNDLDDNVVNLFQCIRNDPEKLSHLIWNTPYARSEYERAFAALYQGADLADAYERAWAFLVCCMMGHGFRTDGSRVGWKNDVSGREKSYALSNWNRFPEQVFHIAERLKQAQIENMDVFALLERYDRSNVCIYLDPPYVQDARRGKSYKYEFTNEQHEHLLDFCLKSQAKIILSGYQNPMYEDALDEWKLYRFRSQTQYGYPRTECIWTNFAVNDYEQMSLRL